MSSEWINLEYIDDKNKLLINNYFKNVTGKFKYEDNKLFVNIDNWGIETFYINNKTDDLFYKVLYNNFRKIYSLAISIQVGNWSTFLKMEHFLNNFKNININIYIVLTNNIINDGIINSLKKYTNITILCAENRGMDIGLFLVSMHYIKNNKFKHDYLYKIHTKTHDPFRNETLFNLLGTHDRIINNIKLLSSSDVGMISGNVIYKYHENKDIFNSNYYHVDNLIKYLYNEHTNNNLLEFPAATFFIVKMKIFNLLTVDKLEYLYSNLNNFDSFDIFWYSMFYNININNKIIIYKDYINNKSSRYSNNLNYQIKTGKPGLRDCMVEHAFERLFGYICRKEGYNILRHV
jgi:hypothetical protein